MTRSDWARLDYNPEPDEKHLVHLIEAFLREPPADQTSWRRVLRRHPKPVGGSSRRPRSSPDSDSFNRNTNGYLRKCFHRPDENEALEPRVGLRR